MMKQILLYTLLYFLISCKEDNDEFTISTNTISIDGKSFKIDCEFKYDSLFNDALLKATITKSNPTLEIHIQDSINFGTLAVLEKKLKKIGIDSIQYKVDDQLISRNLTIEKPELKFEYYTDIYIHPTFFELRRNERVIDLIRPKHLLPLIKILPFDDCEPFKDLKLTVTEISVNHSLNYSNKILLLILDKSIINRMGNIHFQSNYQCLNEKLEYKPSTSIQSLDSTWFRGFHFHKDSLIKEFKEKIEPN